MFLLEWSRLQRRFHIDEVRRGLNKNLSIVIYNEYIPDYIPIGIFKDRLTASIEADKLVEKFPNVFLPKP
jgi:hypothetical protein